VDRKNELTPFFPCEERGISRQTLYRHVGPDGVIRPDGRKLLQTKGGKGEEARPQSGRVRHPS
jgi:hypothetical protein